MSAPIFILLNQAGYSHYQNLNNSFYPERSTLSIDNQAGLIINQKRDRSLYNGMYKNDMFHSVDVGVASVRCPNLYH